MTDVAEKSKPAMSDVGVLAAQSGEADAGNASDKLEDPAVQELTAALEARDRLLSLIGHELRNSLAPMMLLAEQFGTLAEGSQPLGKLLTRVGMLTNNLNKLMATIGRIVDVADLRRGKVLLAPSTTDLIDVIRDVCSELAREAAAGGCDLAIDAEAQVVGHWDRARLRQIVSHVVDNAIRYGGGGRIDITVRSGPTEAALAIRDHGPGIDAALLPHLFSFFENPPKQRPRGPGLGLWIVHTLCTAMGAGVNVENCCDGGARFCVVLPRGSMTHG
jgi:signal transduction histidine kinase